MYWFPRQGGARRGRDQPALSAQIRSLDADGVASARYRAAEARVRGVGIFLGALAVLVVFDMVVKPQL